MGFLDHSTNNVVVDAVLTNKGRKLLASGLGNFSIAKFAFADDEVDYTIVKKFGRTVGKEKIEKNTPVFEALTSGNLGLRHKNVSINNNTLIRLPVLEVSSGLTASGVVSLTRSSTDVSTPRTKTVQVEQKIVGGVRLDHDVINYSYDVVVDHLFLTIAGAIPDEVDANNNARYTIRVTESLSSAGCSKVGFTLVPNLISDITFNQYSYAVGSSRIVTRPVVVRGLNDGQMVSFNVNIQ